VSVPPSLVLLSEGIKAGEQVLRQLRRARAGLVDEAQRKQVLTPERTLVAQRTVHLSATGRIVAEFDLTIEELARVANLDAPLLLRLERLK